MTTDINKLYDMVNSFMAMIGEPPFSKSGQITDKEELKSLIDRYISRLRSTNPNLANIPDEAVPDAILRPLRDAYAEMP